MKTSDLNFEPHSADPNGTRATVQFPNGYGASIVTGPLFYTSEKSPYEVAVLNADGSLNYDTPITEDVLGYLTEQEVDETLTQIESL